MTARDLIAALHREADGDSAMINAGEVLVAVMDADGEERHLPIVEVLYDRRDVLLVRTAVLAGRHEEDHG